MRVDLNIPVGLCQCGCGQPAPIAKQTCHSRGWIKGQPIRYRVGHASRHSTNPMHLAKQFWPMVDRKGPDECWPWLGGTNSDGYATFHVAGKGDGAHRIAYALARGPIPDDLFILHSCDNPRCCNPAHLFAGTHDDNMADMVSKGRGRTVVGSASMWAKLTEEQVLEARRLFQNRHPQFGYTALARLYGVHMVTMYDAINRRTWKHLP